MKGLIYREVYLIRKPVSMMLIAYVIFLVMFSLIMISTYAGNLAKDDSAQDTCKYLYSMMYIYAACIAIGGAVLGHNDMIEKDYKSKWQLYSYTLPLNEKKVAASKFIVRGGLLLIGFVLAVLADIILSAAAKKPISFSHFKNMLLVLLLYGAVCIADIPLLLRMKSQAKAIAVALAVLAPIFAGLAYGGYKFIKFCYAEGARLYPGMADDSSMKKVAMSYLSEYRETLMWAAPFIFAGSAALCYFLTVKELKRRRY